MQRIATLNEIALKKGAPEVWKKQRDFCDTSVEEQYWLNGAPFTSISANKYSFNTTVPMQYLEQHKTSPPHVQH